MLTSPDPLVRNIATDQLYTTFRSRHYISDPASTFLDWKHKRRKFCYTSRSGEGNNLWWNFASICIKNDWSLSNDYALDFHLETIVTRANVVKLSRKALQLKHMDTWNNL